MAYVGSCLCTLGVRACMCHSPDVHDIDTDDNIYAWIELWTSTNVMEQYTSLMIDIYDSYII